MIHSGVSRLYPHPVQFIQQLDISAMPSYTEFPGLHITSHPQSCSVSHPVMAPIDNNSIHSWPTINDFPSGRSNFCIPSTATFTDTPTVQGLSGSFLNFRHYSSQMTLIENSCHNVVNKSHEFTKTLGNSSSKQQDVPDSGSEYSNNYATLDLDKKQLKCKDKKEKTKKLRFLKPGCLDLCRRCCNQKISQSMRKDIFDSYWNLDDGTKRKEFIAQNAIKMPMMKCKEGSRRSFSVDWAFLVNGESFSVCKLFFLHTLDIPESTAYAAVKNSTFFNGDRPVIKARGHNKDRLKPTWFETDLDKYSLEKNKKYTQETTCKSFKRNNRFSEMGPGCTELCRRNCQLKFIREERLAIFNEYRNLCNIRKQREYISNLINRVERKRIRAGKNTRRGCSIQWNLSSKGRQILVCKTFFLHTVGISERAAYNIVLRNKIQPIERAVTNSVASRSSNILRKKSKRFCSIIAKEKLKSALKFSRRQKKVVNYVSGNEEDMNGKCYNGLWNENHRENICERKNNKHRHQSRKQVSVRTVETKKIKVENAFNEETINKKMKHGKKKSGDSLKTTTLLNIPIKIRKNNKLPIFRITEGKVFPISRKQRNPYRRKEMPMKHFYSLCPENCRKKCRRNLTEEARKEIFKEFWSLKNMGEQRRYIAKCVKKVTKPTCTCLVASQLRAKRRGYTISWSLSYRGLHVAVCKTYFMHVLQVSDSIVYKAIRESEGFTSDVTVEQCKHFTGHHRAPKALSCADAVPTHTIMCHEGDKENQEASKIENLKSINEENCTNEFTSETAAYKMDNSWAAKNIITSDKVGCTEILAAGTLESESSSKDVPTSSQFDENVEKTQAQLPHCTHSGLSHIVTTCDTFIPCLDKHPQDSSHTLQVHYPPQQLTSYGPNERVRNGLNLTQTSISGTSICHNDFWQKSSDFVHPVFNNNPPVLPETCVGASQTLSHPRDHPPCLTFPHLDTHHSYPYHPAQTSAIDRRSTFLTQLYPNVSAPHVSYVNEKDFTNDIIARSGFYHSARLQGFPSSVIMPQNCLPNHVDHQTYNDIAQHQSQVLNSMKNTDDIHLSNQNKHNKSRVKKGKSISSSKLREEKTSQAGKNTVKKPFTKHIKEGCLNTCKRKCGLKVSQETRQEIFKEFWNLDSDARRREYILPIVNKVPKKTCIGANSRRCCTIEWSLPCREKRHIVCKRFFLDTFDLGEKFIQTMFDKVERKGGSMEDLRGRHCKRSSVFVQEQEEIEKQVRSASTLKTLKCITCKKDFTRWCLGQGTIVSQLYKMYSDKRKTEGKKPACRTSYTDICNKKFHLKNNKHQACVCDSCAAHTNMPQGHISDLNSGLR